MKEKKLLLIIFLNISIILSEIIFGFISNSFALIADALHNAGDIIAIIITYIALRLSSIKTTFKYTFGFLKAEMMAAFLNTMFLFLSMLYMIYEAIQRFSTPQIIEPKYMIVVGSIALLANGISAYILNNMGVSTCPSHGHYHHKHEDINIKSAYLHMLSDALISVGVVLAGIFIYFFKIYYIDSILTIIFCIYILNHSYPLLKKSFLSLLDINTTNISKEQLDSSIKVDARILEYHDLHINEPSSKHKSISFHIVFNDENIILKECEKIIMRIKQNLKHYGFSHIIIQNDTYKNIKNQIHCDIYQ